MKPVLPGRPALNLAAALSLLAVASALGAEPSTAPSKAKPEAAVGFAQPVNEAQNSGRAGHDLSIVNAQLIWTGPARKDNRTQLDATLENVIELLRELYPNANFIISPGCGDVLIADLKLRNANAEETLQAICIASGRSVVWRDEHLTANGTPDPYQSRDFIGYGGYGAVGGGRGFYPPVDPTTGLPAAGGTPQTTPGTPPEVRPLFVLDASPHAPNPESKPKLQVEAFSLAGYLESQLDAANPNEFQALAKEEVGRLRLLIERTVEQYSNLNRHLNPDSKGSNAGSLSVNFHDSAKLLVVMGDPEAVAVAAKIVDALPGVRSSVYRGRSESAGPDLDPFMNRYGGTAEFPIREPRR